MDSFNFLPNEVEPTNWMLNQCRMSGGASGGPWIQPMNAATGSGTIISVNSWTYNNGSPGMAGVRLDTAYGSNAECLFDVAKKGKDPRTNGIVSAC
eukprot:10550357-Ditylum_brightwellii.AAC.1